mgnify:CR=1 FL=1
MVKLTCFTKERKDKSLYTTCLQGQKKPKKKIEKPKAKTPLKKKEPAFSFGDVMGKVGGGTKEKGYREPAKAKAKATHKMPDGTVMSGKTHSKDSKPVKPKSVEKSVEPPKKSTENKKDDFLNRAEVKKFITEIKESALVLTKKKKDEFLNSFKRDEPSKSKNYFWKDTYKIPETEIKNVLLECYKILAKKGDVRTTTLINDTKRKLKKNKEGLRFEKVRKGDIIINSFIRSKKETDFFIEGEKKPKKTDQRSNEELRMTGEGDFAEQMAEFARQFDFYKGYDGKMPTTNPEEFNENYIMYGTDGEQPYIVKTKGNNKKYWLKIPRRK